MFGRVFKPLKPERLGLALHALQLVYLANEIDDGLHTATVSEPALTECDDAETEALL